MNTNDKRATVLMLMATVIFGGLLASRAGAVGEASCMQQENPLVWKCETMTIASAFEWGQNDYNIGSISSDPATPWNATFVCNGTASGIVDVWVVVYPYADKSSLKIEPTQLFCQAVQPTTWNYVYSYLCAAGAGSWAGQRCRDAWWPWLHQEIRIEE